MPFAILIPMKALKKYVLMLFSLLLTMYSFAQPVINSFAPISGSIGTTVVVTGSNFSPTASNNTVYFGAVKAAVVSATSTSLNVTVPAGATYEPVTVTVNGLTAFSSQPFIVTFPGGGAITTASFNGKTTYATGGSPYNVSMGDIDGDGKADLVVVNGGYPYSVSVYRNTSTSGNISFAQKMDFPTELVPFYVAIADISGDDKPELVIANNASHTVTILQNTSTTGTVSFLPAGSFATGTTPTSVAVGELDGDGKPDLVVTNFSSHSISLLRNTSGSGSISFAAKVDYPTGQYPQQVSMGDWDGDGRADITVLSDAGASIYRNTSTLANVSLTGRTDYLAGAVVRSDLDGDGKPDMVVTNTSGVSIYRNTGNSGSIGFAAKVDFPVTSDLFYMTVADLDGDGKPDLAVTNHGDSVAVIRNTSTTGNLSFDASANFHMVVEHDNIRAGDIDGDGRPELVTTDAGGEIVAVLRNTIDAPNVVSFTPNSAPTGISITITGTNFTGATAVSFGDQPAASFVVVNAGTITAVTATGSTGNVKVTTPAGNGSRSGFTFLYPPAITGFTPAISATGGVITISGTAFTGATAVSFGGTPATSFTVVSSTSITAVVAAGSSGVVSVTTPYGTVSLPGFTYVAPQAAPSITSFAPVSGPAGTTVTIHGTNFNTDIAGNIVYFGAAQATVVSATATDLTVRTPTGATYEPITITVGQRTAYSPKAFMPTFPGIGTFNTSSLETAKTFIGNILSYSIVVADIDGDGKPDMLTVNDNVYNSVVSVLRNTSTPGIVSFASKVDFPTGLAPYRVTTGDIDGDGKLDLVVANDASSSISVLKNTSTPGSISFAPKVDFPAISHPYSVAVTDFDADGRPDIVVANAAAGKLSIFRNTTLAGVISFDPKTDYVTGTDPYYVAVGDLDGDGKPDMAAVNFSNHTVATFRNTSTSGSISFAPKVDFPTGIYPTNLTIKDVNADGKPELIVVNSALYDNMISVYKNISTPGTIAFAANVDLSAGVSPIDVTVTDIDGDGKPDIAGVSTDDHTLSVFSNKGSGGSIAFEARVNYYLGSEISAAAIASGDMDSDGKPDILVSDYEYRPDYAFIAVLRNRMIEPLVSPSGASPVSGFVEKRVAFDPTVQSFNGNAYVQRHYDITPANNAATATATIVLYFTQQDFDNYNAHPSHGSSLPVAYWDYSGRSNLRVYQYHGTSATGLPGSYTGGGVEINPVDNDIVWNTTTNCWEITFPVTGFSGFFVSSAGNSILPLTLLSFTGQQRDGNSLLQWVTTAETAIDRFELEKSGDGNAYTTIAKIAPKGGGNVNTTYQYTDLSDNNPVRYYRLKIIDQDGRYSYSHIVKLEAQSFNATLTVYPNPARDFITATHPAFSNEANMQVIDPAGRIIKNVRVKKNVRQTSIDMTGLPTGLYKIILRDGKNTYTQTVLKN